jgi:hypothetical protein
LPVNAPNKCGLPNRRHLGSGERNPAAFRSFSALMNTGISTRPNLLPTAALVSLLVLLLGVTSLFVLSYSNTRSAAALERLHTFHAAQLAAVKAQVSFKTQVQEWKNLLLRGRVADDYASYLARFQQCEADTQSSLALLQSHLNQLSLDSAEATRLATDHASLGRSYRSALASYRPADPATGFAVDAAIRGIDRPLNDAIDTLAQSVAAASTAEFAAYRAAANARYLTLRRVTLGAGTLAVFAAFWLVFQAARPASRPAHVRV